MEHEYLALAARIETFELDEPGVADTFSRRLARENGWTAAYAHRVMREYKRFLVLAATVPHVVTPSEQVDQAWHQHVLYSARYRRFCAEVLGRRLDHGPSDGGRAEHDHYVRAYRQTLSSYEQRFGERPPSDIWPNAARRFGSDLATRRVNLAEHWVLRKPRLWLWLKEPRRLAGASTGCARFAPIALAAFVGGCHASLSDHANGPSYLEGFLLLWLVTTAIAPIGKRVRRRGATSPVPVLEPYALAQLAGGPLKALGSAVASLIARGCVELDTDGRTLTARLAAPSSAPAFEREVYEQIASAGRLESRTLRRQAAPLTQALADDLLRAKLTSQGSTMPLLVALVAPILGTFRILSRLGSDKPLSILVCLTILATAFAFWAFRPRLERTPLGDAAVAQAREVHEPLIGRACASDLADSGTLPIVFALFGTDAVSGLPASTSSLDRWNEYSVSSDFGATCGADSGGGGAGCSSGCSAGCGGGGGCGGCSGGD